MRATTNKQPWQITMHDMHRDHLESQRKRFKLMGNLGFSCMDTDSSENMQTIYQVQQFFRCWFESDAKDG